MMHVQENITGEESNKSTVIITHSVLSRDLSAVITGRPELQGENIQQDVPFPRPKLVSESNVYKDVIYI